MTSVVRDALCVLSSMKHVYSHTERAKFTPWYRSLFLFLFIRHTCLPQTVAVTSHEIIIVVYNQNDCNVYSAHGKQSAEDTHNREYNLYACMYNYIYIYDIHT